MCVGMHARTRVYVESFYGCKIFFALCNPVILYFTFTFIFKWKANFKVVQEIVQEQVKLTAYLMASLNRFLCFIFS
jgi:hypothetical protein